MKHIKILLIAAIVLTFSACKKTETERPKLASVLTMNLNGESRQSVAFPAPNATFYNSTPGGGVQIMASFSNQTEVMSISIQGQAVTKGTYDVAKDGVIVTYLHNPSLSANLANAQTWMGKTGTVTITQITATSIAGQFNIVAAPVDPSGYNLNLTQGTFYITNFINL